MFIASIWQITVCLMKRTKKGYVKDGMMIEIMLDKEISYEDLLLQCKVDLEAASPRADEAFALFTTGGALIKDVEGWTLQSYMQQQHRGPGKIRLGLGYIKKVCSQYRGESLIDSIFSLQSPKVILY